MDIDPNNVENISVLKGLSATVLIGELGKNGVILVTTKNGAGKEEHQENRSHRSHSPTSSPSRRHYLSYRAPMAVASR